MITRPTTDHILLDCEQELIKTIDPAVEQPAVKIALQMMENVLRNCAVRAAHEIAWMREETDAMLAYAWRVSESPAGTPAVAAAIAAYERGRSDSLHLQDVCETYSLAGACLATAIEAAMAGGDTELELAGRAVLELRLAHENEVMGKWTMVGRA